VSNLDGNGNRPPEAERRREPRRLADRVNAAKLLRWWVGGLTFIFIAVLVNSCQIRNGQDEQTRALEGSCNRVNTLRANDNEVAATQYETLVAAADLIPGESPVGDRFRELALGVNYIPLTDCKAAVGTPREFTPPAPIPFHKLSEDEREAIRQTGHT
jgi:hypothetical protein